MAGAVTQSALANGGAPALPRLRPELRLLEGRPTGAGGIVYLIEDPLRHRFVEIDLATRALLSCLPDAQDVDDLVQRVFAIHGLVVRGQDVEALARFLAAHELLDEPLEGGWRAYLARARRQRQAVAVQLAHKYLFFRLPLMRPQAFLRATQVLVAPLYSWTFLAVTMLAGLLGLYLVLQQWDEFFATFGHYASWQGIAALGLTLLVVKALHELGHAYTAVRYGCTVPTIGVAFMVLMPLLYTDVTDTWRLRQRKQRLAVDGAGIAVELIVALYATFLWSFLPEGPAKSACFMLASAGWVLSLAINLNPFMRFDGYYLLCELTGIANLQPRAFAVGRWLLREVLFGLGEACPERFTKRSVLLMAAYAYGVWLYRLVLFVGIAVLVYVATFKVLGVILFALEIIFLVAMPVWRELREWAGRFDAIKASPRAWVTAGIFAVLLAGVFVPWSGRVAAPAVLGVGERFAVYAPRTARLVSVHVAQGQAVEQGQLLFELRSERLQADLRLAETRLKLIEARLARAPADGKERAQIQVILREREALQVRVAGLLKERAALQVRAPAAGTVLQVEENLTSGLYVGKERRLALIGPKTVLRAFAYLAEDDVGRVKKGTRGVFVLDDPFGRKAHVTVSTISLTANEMIAHPALTRPYGGSLDAEVGRDGTLHALSGRFLTVLEVGMDKAPGHEVRGVVHLAGVRMSFAAWAWLKCARVLVRELGV